MGTDKKNIWNDCPACAYKHLTAAYALLSSGAVPDGFVLDMQTAHLARAVITLGEALTGYEGNRAVALGCLVAAEGMPGPVLSDTIRTVRVAAGEKKLTGEVFQSVRDLLPPVRRIAGYIVAHILEAARELPELADPLQDITQMSLSFEPAEEAYVCPKALTVADELIPIIRNVEDTYELGVRYDIP